MKKLIHIALGLALVFGMSSCEDYLDAVSYTHLTLPTSDLV